MRALVAEAVATFALCFIGGGSIIAANLMGAEGGGLVAVALAHGLILAIVVSATFNVSGGHVNPAVTLALMVTGNIKVANAAGYIIAQCFGGMIGGVLLLNVTFNGLSNPNGGDPILETNNGTPTFSVEKLAGQDMEFGRAASQPGAVDKMKRSAAMRAMYIEAALTFLLVFAVYGTAVDPRHPNVGGFAIGLTVAADILVGGPLTGAAMNPARVLGTGFMNGPEFWEQHWVYWAGPCAGGVLAGVVYKFLIAERKKA